MNRLTKYRQHYVYRCYSATDELLYIGFTCNPKQRMAQHRKKSPWWPEVAWVTTEAVDGMRHTVHGVEARAIRNEDPKYNLHHTATPTQDAALAEVKAKAVAEVFDSIAKYGRAS